LGSRISQNGKLALRCETGDLMERAWRYRSSDGRDVGPLLWEELVALARAGRVRPRDPVRFGDGPSSPAERYEGLFAPPSTASPVPEPARTSAWLWLAWSPVIVAAAGLALAVRHYVVTRPAPVTKPSPQQAGKEVKDVAKQMPPAPAPVAKAEGAPKSAVRTRLPGSSAPMATARPAASGTPFPAPRAAPAYAGDERLFLLYKLERLNLGFSQSASDLNAFVESVRALRESAIGQIEDLKGRKFDPDVVALYAEIVATADESLDLLRDLGRIDRDSAARRQTEQAESGFRSGMLGGQFGAAAYENGATSREAVLGAAAIGFVSYLLEDSANGQQRDEARRRAEEALVAKYRERSETRAARFRASLRNLAERHDWPRGSVPFLDPLSESSDANPPTTLADTIATLDRAGKRRAFDPYVALELGGIACGRVDLRSGSLSERAEDCVRAIALVPPGRAYDPERIACWGTASALDLRAAESGDPAALGRAKSAIAAALALDPADATGHLRALKMAILEQDGDRVAAFALGKEIARVQSSNFEFVVRFTRYQALFGESASALVWLRHLVTNFAFEDVAALREEAAFAGLAQHDAKEWDRLTVPRWTLSPDRGFFSSDLVMTNQSPFPLTNVILRVSAAPAGEPKWSRELKVARIAPGESFRWTKVEGVPGSSVTISATMACNQSSRK
jgi:hypothetical protein